MNWPALVIVALNLIGLGISIEQHGTPRKGTNNAWVSLVASVLTLTLLYLAVRQ